MQYRVLGSLEVRNGDDSLPLAGAKQRALLALLLVHANRVLSRDRLIDELWGDQPPPTAVTSLQVYVSRLRKLLPAGTLLTLSSPRHPPEPVAQATPLSIAGFVQSTSDLPARGCRSSHLHSEFR